MNIEDIIKIASPLIAALVGGVLGGWLSDFRRQRADNRAREQRERALLTGMHAVRDHIGVRLQNFETGRRISDLGGLRSALKYADQIVERMPTESEAIMMAFMELALKLNAVVEHLDAPVSAPDVAHPLFLARLNQALDELIEGVGNFDVVAASTLSFMSDEELIELVTNPEDVVPSDGDQSTHRPKK